MFSSLTFGLSIYSEKPGELDLGMNIAVNSLNADQALFTRILEAPLFFKITSKLKLNAKSRQSI